MLEVTSCGRSKIYSKYCKLLHYLHSQTKMLVGILNTVINKVFTTQNMSSSSGFCLAAGVIFPTKLVSVLREVRPDRISRIMKEDHLVKVIF